jgi:signal transduction histidine kinase
MAEAAKAEVERLDTQKTVFFQNLSHDFRTPLTLILNVFGKLDRELPEHRAVAMGKRNTKRLAKLVDELLDYQKIEGGNSTLTLGPVSISKVIDSVESYFDASFEQRGLTFSKTWPESWSESSGEGWVQADPEALERILVNFVANAMKHTESGGRIELFALSPAEIDPVIRVGVRDSGVGIAEADLKAIFEPFVQAKEHEGQGGTGLGLALCKKLAEQMVGRIGVESSKGEGSTFWVDLRAVGAPSQADSATTSSIGS